jgi:hypothetical protein
MPAPRRTQALPADFGHQMDGFAGLLKRQLNNILTVLLLAAAVFLFVRWRMKVAETEKLTIAGYMGNAREGLQELESGNFAEQMDSDNPGKIRTLIPSKAFEAAQVREADIEKNISDVLNSSSVDERTKLQALQLRGDLYWTLANFLQAVNASGTGAGQTAETPDTLLTKASAAYGEIAGADHTKYAEQVDGAKMGLAAIAINKADWAGAQKLFQEVVDDSTGPGFLRDQAKAQIAGLPALKTPSILVVATSEPAAVAPVVPTTNSVPALPPIYGPMLPPSLQSPPSLPPVSATMPTSLPVIPTPTSMPGPTPMLPATIPVK